VAARPHAPEKDEALKKAAREATKDLKGHWYKVGQSIGLIPTRQGGKTDLIPDKWLLDLKEQGKGLLAEVREYEPNAVERDAVRALLLAEPYPE